MQASDESLDGENRNSTAGSRGLLAAIVFSTPLWALVSLVISSILSWKSAVYLLCFGLIALAVWLAGRFRPVESITAETVITD